MASDNALSRPSDFIAQRDSLAGSAARKNWIDIAKGLCILFVVACHEIRGLVGAGIMSADTAWQFWDNFFYTFQVPVFFFVSGLLAERSYDKCGFRQFLKTKLTALAYPYAVWQTLQVLMMIAAAGSTRGKASLDQLLWLPVYPIMQFWFLYVLMLVLAFYAVLKWAKFSNLAILAVSVGMVFLPNLSWFPFNSLCEHMVYFSLALVLRDRMESLASFRSSSLLLETLALGSVLAVIAQDPIDQNAPFRVVPAILGGSATLTLSFVLARWRWSEAVTVIGRRSLEIFVAHSVFSAGTRIVLLKLLHVDDLALHVVLGMIASLGGPLLLVRAERLPGGFRLPLFKLDKKIKRIDSTLPGETDRTAATGLVGKTCQ